MNRHTKKIGLLTLSALATTLALEVGLRLAGTMQPRNVPVYPGELKSVDHGQGDPHVGWKMPVSDVAREANEDFDVQYTSNEIGFRDGGDPIGTELNRIAFLGDSMTFGIGVEDHETFAEIVESHFTDVEALNLGMSGFGIDQMWMSLRHYALPRRPALVVVSFILDDLNRSMTSYRKRGDWMAKPSFYLDGDRLVLKTQENRPSLLVRLIEQESRLYEALRRWQNHAFRTRAWGSRWQLNRAIFKAIAEDCHEADVPLMVVFLIPRGETAACTSLVSEFESLGIPFLDLQEELRSDPWSLYFSRDRHLNPAGHRFAAERIATFIEENGLLADRNGY